MKTQNISIRISPDLIKSIDAFARSKEWSRNYVISKFLKEKIYELSKGMN